MKYNGEKKGICPMSKNLFHINKKTSQLKILKYILPNCTHVVIK